MADTTTEIPAGAESAPPGGAEPGAAPARPEHIPEKFWDKEAGAPRTDDLAKGYTALQSAFGRRLQEVSPETRRMIAETFEDDVKKDWEAALKTQLAEDAEFLTPLQEKWRAENLRTPPEAYEPPDVGRPIATDSELYAEATDWAKKSGLDQDQFGEFMTFVTKAQIASEIAQGAAPIAQWQAEIKDMEPRITAVHNRAAVFGAAGDVEQLMEDIRRPGSFRALEAIVKGTSSKPMALEGAASNGEMTQGQIDELMKPGYQSNPEINAKVEAWYRRRYSDQF